MPTYQTFKRSARNWEEFSSARKLSDMRGLTLEEARQRCEEWNRDRDAAQIRRGTKLEFTTE